MELNNYRILDSFLCENMLVLGEKGRSESLAASGQAPVFPGAKKKLSTTGGPTPSAQQKEKSADPADANPFAEELRAKRLPLDCTLPVAWALPPGFSLRHLDGAVYLPLFAHGLRDPTEHLGVPLGAVASEVTLRWGGVSVRLSGVAIVACVRCLWPPLCLALTLAAVLSPAWEGAASVARVSVTSSPCTDPRAVSSATSRSLCCRCARPSPSPPTRWCAPRQIFAAAAAAAAARVVLARAPLAC